MTFCCANTSPGGGDAPSSCTAWGCCCGMAKAAATASDKSRCWKPLLAVGHMRVATPPSMMYRSSSTANAVWQNAPTSLQHYRNVAMLI